MADVNLALELVRVVLEAGTATALGQAELVDRLLALAAEEDGDLAEPVGELGRAEAGVGKVGDSVAFLVGRGLGLAGVVHGYEDGARLEEDGGEVVAQELGGLLLIGYVDAGEGEEGSTKTMSACWSMTS